MKKIIFSIAVMVSAFFAASCQQEMLETQAGLNTVTYTVEIPNSISTKATGDGFTLHYEVYRQNDLSNLDADPIYDGTKAFADGYAAVELEFVKGQEFTVLFWAQQTNGTQAYGIDDLREVSLQTLVANDLTAEVFAGKDHVEDCKSDNNGNVVLVRPVAQLNIATNDDSFTLGTIGSTTAPVVPSMSKIVVNGLYDTYNVAEGTAGTKATRTYTETDVPGTDFKDIYKLMATNYLGFISQTGDNVDVTFTIWTNEGEITHVVSNVPVKANYQTNILGNLITATADYRVTLEDWSSAEITHATNTEAAQAALDNAAAGTIIKLQPGVNYGTLYMRPIDGGAQTKVVDWIGNNYGFETYSLFENITIVGAEGATVDAIKIEGGTYYNTEHSQAATYPVMLSLVELKNVVFDGVTFTGKGGYDPQGYGNAVNLSGNNIKVDGLTFKNCVLNNSENKARLLYKTESTTHVHNYSYDGETYTFSPSLKDITITGCTLNGGYMGLELREAENVTITNNTFNVADRNILLPVNTGCTYSGNITITGNVSNNAKERFVRADGTGDAVVVISNNTLNNYMGEDADYIKVSNGNNVTIENNTVTSRTVPANNTEDVVLNTETIEVTVPAESAEAGATYKVVVTNENTETDATTGETTVGFDLTMYKNDVKVSGDVIYEVTKNLGAGLIISEVTHNGTALTEANTGDDQTYAYDSATGVLTIYTKSFSPFEVTYIELSLEETFADNSWKNIILACENNAVPTSWNVGDTKAMTIGKYTYDIAIIGKNHDVYSDGSGKAPLTLQLFQLYGTDAQMNETQDNTIGWSGSKMRNTTMEEIRSVMPDEVKNAIKAVDKVSLNGSKNALETTSDKLFLLSEKEVNGSEYYSGGYVEGARYAYYADQKWDSNGNLSSQIMKPSPNKDNKWTVSWYLRTPKNDKVDNTRFIAINGSGLMTHITAEIKSGLVFGFCF